MNIQLNQTQKFQEGGAMPAQAPTQGQEQDPLVMIIQMAVQALQNQDANMAMNVCNAIVQLAQSAAQEQGAAPEQSAPAQPEGEPVFRKGGVLVRRNRK